ncbi:MAG: alkaline phosphatase D family protein [Akkermansiaceae bacterium]|nr:alkaline phosphatase D family protein [Akkermansiaceae bacterium]
MSLGVMLAAPAAAAGKPGIGQGNRGSLEDDMAIFNQVPQPEAVRKFFTAARQAFARQPKGSLADISELLATAEQDGLRILGGPMLGSLAPDGVTVWVRTVKPAQLAVLVRIGDEERKFGPVASTAASDLTAVVEVNGLQPDTRYPYRVLMDGLAVAMPGDAVIHTAPAPQQAGRMKMAFGADFHKTGSLWLPPLLDTVRKRDNSAMLLLGDIASLDRKSSVGLQRADYLLRDFSPAWRELVASVPVYAAWDDHDYCANDASGTSARFTAADRSATRASWMRNWNNPSYGFADDGHGIFFRTRIGPCDVIMLDTRYFRQGRGQPDCFLGAEQMRWLEKELTSCTGPFVILTSGTMWSDYISAGKDSWGVFDPAGRERIFSLIEEKRIGGVLLLSGDRHGARVLQIPRPSGFVFYEFEMGSLGGCPGPGAIGRQPELQPLGLVNQQAFGEFTFDTTVADPTVTMRAVDPDGKELYQLTLKRSQMMPGGK